MKEISKIKLIVFDFDGVLTDNRVGVLDDGREFVMCNRSDGLGFDMLKKANIPMLILSTETSSVVEARAAKINVQVIYGCSDKAKTLSIFCKENNFNLDDVAFIGNDANDLEVMQIVGYKFCPSDAHECIKSLPSTCLRVKGGFGVVRELAELILDKRSE